MQQGDTILQNVQNPDVVSLKNVVASLKNKLKILSDLNDSIMGSPDVDLNSIEQYILDFDERSLENEFAISRYQVVIDSKSPVQNATANTGTQPDPTGDARGAHRPTSKLAKLTLPTFSGQILEFASFWDIFRILCS